MNIAEAAERMGVSRMTISYALNGNGRLNPETRRRVLAQLEELGCAPNVHAQRLASGRTNVLVFDDRRPALFSDLFARELLRGVQKAAALRNYSLLLNLATEAGDAQLAHMARSQAMDGVILAGHGAGNQAMLEEIAATGRPCVTIGGGPDNQPGIGRVQTLLEGEREAVRHLLSLGHRRIGLIDHPAPWSDAGSQTFIAELQAGGVSPEIAAVPAECEDDIKGGGDAAHLLLRENPGLTALLCRTDSYALGALYAAWERGRRVPEDLSIVGHDDLPISRYTQPPLTTVRSDFERVAETAVVLLLQMVERPEPRPTQWLPSRLIIRHSTAPPAASR